MPDENAWRAVDMELFEVRNVLAVRLADQIRVMPGNFTVTAGTWIQDPAAVRVTFGPRPVFPGGCVIAIVPDEVE